MNDAPRYATLRDYLRVLRAQRWLILLATLVFAGAALGLSLTTQKTYQSQASLSIHDESQDEALLSDSATTVSDTPAEIAQEIPGMLATPQVIAAVKQQFPGQPVPPGSVSAYLNQATAFVIVQAQSSNSQQAASLANAYAQAISQVERTNLRARFQTAANAAKAQYTRLRDVSRDPVTRALYGDRLARITALATTANPVALAQPAAPSATPVSPKPVRNTLLGGLLGLALGILAAFTRDALDRRLRSSSDIGETLGWPVLGHVRREVLGRAAPLPAAGRPPITDADFEAFRILRQNLLFLDVDRPPRSIVVTSGLPEEGKSTVAASLACASALLGRRTLLIECDLRRPSLAERLGLNSKPGLSDILIGEASLADALQTVELESAASSNGNGPAPAQTAPAPPVTPASPAPGTWTGPGGARVPGPPPGAPLANGQGGYSGPLPLTVITAGSHTSHPAELLGSQRLAQLIDGALSQYEMVVLDTSPVLSVADALQVLSRGQAALVCVRAGSTTRDEASALKEAMERLPSRPTGIVVTGLRPGSEGDFGYYSYSYAYPDKA